jgi:hypothetical protein
VTWNVKGTTAASDRFNCDYPDAELAELTGRIHKLADQAQSVQALQPQP